MNEEAILKMISIYEKDILGCSPDPRAKEMLLTLCISIERTTRDAAAAAVNDCANIVRKLNH